MTPPTPAAVRFCMFNWGSEQRPKPEEHGAYMEDPRTSSEILADHIRAIAAGMRNLGDAMRADRTAAEVRQVLREYADKLEGREP